MSMLTLPCWLPRLSRADCSPGTREALSRREHLDLREFFLRLPNDFVVWFCALLFAVAATLVVVLSVRLIRLVRRMRQRDQDSMEAATFQDFLKRHTPHSTD